MTIKRLMRSLFNQPDDRFDYIWEKLNFKNPFLFGYIKTIWREKELSREKTTFNQIIELRAEFSLKRIVKNENEIFPHSFRFRLYEVDDPRDVDVEDWRFLISMEEFLGETLILKVREERLIYFGNLTHLLNLLRKELNRDPNEQKFIVWRGTDPRIIGDYYGEVAEVVAFIGYKDEAIDFYQRAKQYKGRGEYISYPTEYKGDFKKGEKRIIHPNRSPPSNRGDYEVERWELEHGY